MTKSVQVYFHTDDEAEKLRAKLSKYKASNVMIDHLEELDDSHLVVPYLPHASGGTSMGNPGTGSQAVAYQDVEVEDQPRRTVITFDVEENDLEDVLIEIQKMSGHVDRALFE